MTELNHFDSGLAANDGIYAILIRFSLNMNVNIILLESHAE